MSVTARVSIDVNGTVFGVNDLGTPSMPFLLNEVVSFTPGALSGQANLVFSDNRTIAASANDDLDLNGSLPGPLGGTLAFTAIRAIIIRAAATNTNNVVVGAAASNQFVGPFGAATHTLAIRPGDEMVLTARGAGWTVTPTTGDILRIANSGAGTPVSYDIILLGS
jgi:hypothetical protein